MWLVFGLGACRAKTTSARKPQPKVSVVATVFPLADVARQIGGEYVEVSWLLESGQTLQGVELKPELRNRLRNADLALMNSGVTEPWAVEGASSSMQPHHSLRLETLELASSSAASNQRVGFLWLDPLVIESASNELCLRLMGLRPQYEKQLRVQADTFAARLDQLMAEYRQKLAAAQTRKLLVLGPEFDRLLDRFGLIPVATVESSPMRLTDADLKIIRQIAEQNGTRLLVIPADTPIAVRRDLELRGSLQTVPIDPLGSSSGTDDRRSTYLGLMRLNLEELLRATTVR